MGRAPKDDKMELKKGSWSAEEDQLLINFIHRYGHNNWLALPKQAGLLRCGKSCRLRWNNYLRPDIKRGNFTSEEKQAIIILHQVLGNRWSAIASHLPGRTGNEIKNVWRSHLQKEIRRMAIDPVRNTVAMHLSWRTAPNSFTSLDKSEYSHVSVEGIPSMKKDELADNLVLCQTEASVDSPTTFSNLSDSFYQSYNLSSEIPSYSEAASGILGSKFDWLQSNLINSFDVALGYDQQPPTIEDDTKLEDLLIDNTLIFENQNFEDEERSLPRQSENATAITASELVFEHSLNVKAHKFMFAYPEYDCLSSIDIADTNPHQLWNIDMEDYSDGVDYWLNVLRQDGPSPTTTTTPGISN